MKTIRSMNVLPEDGKLYGFPKKYTPAKDGDFYEWLLMSGFPIRKFRRDAMLYISDIEYYDEKDVVEGKVE